MDNDNAMAGEVDFPAWYRRTSPRVYAYVRRYCADDDCDDVIAEVYLVAWARLAELPADAVPWLIGTARNVLANSWRARSRRGRLAAELAGLNDLAAADPAGLAVERTDLLRAISRLSADDQEVLLLAGWLGRSGLLRACHRARLLSGGGTYPAEPSAASLGRSPECIAGCPFLSSSSRPGSELT